VPAWNYLGDQNFFSNILSSNVILTSLSIIWSVNYLRVWNRVFKKLIVVQLVKELPFLLNLKAHYCVNNSPSLDLVLSKLNRIHTHGSFEIHFDIVFPQV
jgi:hypothetical protein